MIFEYTLILSIVSTVHGGYNDRLPPAYDPNEKVIDCSNKADCPPIHLVVEALESMTYYDYRDKFGNPSSNTRRKLKGYRAFYNEQTNDFNVNEADQNINKESLQPPIMTNGDFRPIFTINGQMPGPMIVANRGTMLNITVYNELKNNEGISIHWHGMYQKDTPEMDGVPYISHMPILPNQHKIYLFKADPGGTHWYHAHGGTQRTDGIFGALIIKDTLDPEVVGGEIIDIYSQHTLMLMDWSTEPSHQIAQQLISTVSFWKDNLPYLGTKGPDYTAVGPFPFKSGLINDKGRYCVESENVTKCHISASMLNHFDVVPNNVYRFRLIGAQAAYAFKFSIQEHNLTVVATDGNRIQPIKSVQYVIVNTGERYDVLVNTSGHDHKEYWILAETIETRFGESNEDFYSSLHLHKAEAVLRYEGSSQIIEEPSQTWNCKTHLCKVVNCPFEADSSVARAINYDCHNIQDFISTDPIPDAIHTPHDTLIYNFDFNGEYSTNSSSVDGINFRFPSYSPLTDYNKFKLHEQDYICPERGCPYRLYENEDEYCACTHQIKLNHIARNCSVEIVISNINTNPERLGRGSSHPVHLHGHSFYVVRTGYPIYNNNGTGLLNYSQEIACHDWNENKCKEFSTIKHSQNKIMQEIRFEDPSLEKMDTSNRSLSKKDTVIVPYGGYVIIRFVVDNPGWWFFHCHIEIHQMEGMSVVLTELLDEIDYFKISSGNLCASSSRLQISYSNLLETVIILLCITLILID
ncbi:uncharacterized protein [Dysidea avara]|uniref:uncharacterized protein n=1 Tax=Dysidea avara TaxID=196820 RepID=UPI00331D448F